jgi:hypothetical protein
MEAGGGIPAGMTPPTKTEPVVDTCRRRQKK